MFLHPLVTLYNHAISYAFFVPPVVRCYLTPAGDVVDNVLSNLTGETGRSKIKERVDSIIQEARHKVQAASGQPTAIITGGSRGIGFYAAEMLAQAGYRVIIANNYDATHGRHGASLLQRFSRNDNIEWKYIDTSSLQSVRDFVNDISDLESVDILINDAGTIAEPHGVTVDGIETHFATNYLGHFLLSNLLIPKLEKVGGRIVNVVSNEMFAVDHVPLQDLKTNCMNYNTFTLYGISKLAMMMNTLTLAKRLKGTGVSVFAVHPGVVRTQVYQNLTFMKYYANSLLGYFTMKDPESGAVSVVWSAISHQLDGKSGEFIWNEEPHAPNFVALNEKAQDELWRWSEQVCGSPGARARRREE
ncbi:hypothetical protein BKA69DRAFT_1129161 [Paraphysoderma sedebokerense]|nr:hypothetical protein BKA69DRAFT_1129161 [Paraphysoderma sedebokerense]